MRKLESDLMTVNNAMLNFVTAYPTPTYKDTFAHEIYFVIARDPNVGERQYGRRIPAVNIIEAQKCIANAYSLAKNKKLETEIAPRNVTPEEISTEVDKALVFLRKQAVYTVLDQAEAIKWAKESTIPGVNQDPTFKSITEVYDKYRAKIAEMATTLERILSYSPKKKDLPPTRST